MAIGRAVVVPDGAGRLSASAEGDTYSLALRDVQPEDAGEYQLWIDLRERKLTAEVTPLIPLLHPAER